MFSVWLQVISAGGSQRLSKRPKSPFFREAQKHIRARLEKKWVPMFISTTEYLERNVLGSDEMGTSSKTKDRKRSVCAITHCTLCLLVLLFYTIFSINEQKLF